jgi:hypothetical protein
MKPRARIIAVCSDQARNGKTLVARLVADYLILAGRNPLIFDADPHNDGIKLWFPERAFPVELGKTMGQIQLFDRILGLRILGLPYRDHVIDIPAPLYEKFVSTVTQIEFIAEAQARNFATAAFFVIDRSAGTLDAAKEARDMLKLDAFWPVRNAAIGDPTSEGHSLGAFALVSQDGDLALPALSPELQAKALRPGFSFSNFLKEQRPAALTLRERQTMNAFLDAVMAQIDALLTRLDEAAAKRIEGAQA